MKARKQTKYREVMLSFQAVGPEHNVAAIHDLTPQAFFLRT
jgi:hypothetical protein